VTLSLPSAVVAPGSVKATGDFIVGGNISGPSASGAYTIGSDPTATVTAGGFIQLFGSTSGGAGTVTLGNGAVGRLSINSAGTIALAAAAASLSTLTVNGVSTATGNGCVLIQNATSGSGLSTFLDCSNGTDANFDVFISQVGAASKFATIGPTLSIPFNLQTATLARLVIGSTGNVSINAPSSGVALSVASVAANSGIALNSITANQSSLDFNINSVFQGTLGFSGAAGQLIAAGNAAGDLNFRTQGGSINFSANSGASVQAQFTSAGGMTIGSPTGGNQGSGTLNATGLFVNGGQLFFGVPQSANTTAAVSDVGKCILAAGTITVPNSVFAAGQAFSVYNNTAGNITITAGVTTMRLGGTATTGSRTLAQRGMATVWFVSATECVVSGSGVT
jgi:hypothetical protein